MKEIYALVIAIFICFNISAQKNIKLEFNKKGTFKIAQFTDIHWIDGSPNCEKTIATIKYVLETERPNLAVLTGDVAWQVPSRQPRHDMSKIFEDAKIPVCCCFGKP
jgi:predicted MPP superfamily phosphohydrolase